MHKQEKSIITKYRSVKHDLIIIYDRWKQGISTDFLTLLASEERAKKNEVTASDHERTGDDFGLLFKSRKYPAFRNTRTIKLKVAKIVFNFRECSYSGLPYWLF